MAENTLAVAVRDGYAVSDGHTLVVPRRHLPGWFEAAPEEQLAILELVRAVKEKIDREFSPDGYNIGINEGESAGQTIMHLHVHVIPRYQGDVDDPTGGVRLVIPERGNYKRPGHVPRAMKK